MSITRKYVPGMTEKMKIKLLRRFGSVEGIREASDYDIIREVPEKLLVSLRVKLSNS